MMKKHIPNRRGFLKGTVVTIFAGSILSRLSGCAPFKSAKPNPSVAGMEPAAAADQALPYKIGVVEAEITPTWPVMMAGFSARKKPSEGTYDKLYVRAISIDDGKNKVVYLMGDVAYWDRRSGPRPHGAAPNANPTAPSWRTCSSAMLSIW